MCVDVWERIPDSRISQQSQRPNAERNADKNKWGDEGNASEQRTKPSKAVRFQKTELGGTDSN